MEKIGWRWLTVYLCPLNYLALYSYMILHVRNGLKGLLDSCSSRAQHGAWFSKACSFRSAGIWSSVRRKTWGKLAPPKFTRKMALAEGVYCQAGGS